MTSTKGFRARPRFRRLAALVLGTAASLALSAVHAPVASAATPPVVLPADESAHPDAGMEWWYFTGHLTGKDVFGKSHSYGFETMVVRNDGLDTAPTGVIYNVNMSVTDLTRGPSSRTGTSTASRTTRPRPAADSASTSVACTWTGRTASTTSGEDSRTSAMCTAG
ncbi:lipocalin-like domain-containing protein [Parafrankia sp. CH37]|uniref:lipocalin-like domain-containing protein n=1 Tax=Parafrankia sp. CH37 TaxID=683308 RepID=UPI00289B8728|nr:lipocalin-like domain-containing protein [Parafrankia sp. CH37]